MPFGGGRSGVEDRLVDLAAGLEEAEDGNKTQYGAPT